MYGPYLTIPEIEAKYPNQFILIGNPTLTHYHEVRGGYVILRAADRDEFYQRFEEWPGDPTIKHLASWYTGKDTSGVGEILPLEGNRERLDDELPFLPFAEQGFGC